jgi:fibronectin-binding autotransporter adhesin
MNATHRTIPSAIPPAPTLSERKEVAFIDTSVADYQTLVDGIRPGVEVVLLDAGRDGLTQMAEWAQSHTGYDAIHVFSHGSEGALQLGTLRLTAGNLPNHAGQLATLGAALTTDADILLYGCDVGKGSAGAAFVDALAQATQADIAASKDLTGNVAKDGNWVLETTSGVIDSRAFYAKAFEGTLADVTIGTPSGHTAATNSNGAHDIGQTFTATKTGLLNSIRVASNNNDDNNNWTLKIYEGAGVGGTLLRTQTGASIGNTVSVKDVTHKA